MSEFNEDDGVEEHVRTRLALECVRKFALAGDRPKNFVCTDIDGVRRDLNLYYVASKPEGRLHRINAGYPPDELVEEGGLEACRQFRGDPIEFLVAEAEHARMLRDGVLDVVDGQDVLQALCQRSDALLHGQREN
jgi:hypothetical protein